MWRVDEDSVPVIRCRQQIGEPLPVPIWNPADLQTRTNVTSHPPLDHDRRYPLYPHQKSGPPTRAATRRRGKSPVATTCC
jgi:hypothetical protein